ncbi:uncharacterized protein Dana_GF10231 [Drosophila ananassae]|uniref:Uncharacterized protein n=1 Tax=Drosophila ananassae TaxID=7217 RepID=B3M7F8_DROAN|nr:chronophin [Drosophila ananassae]EDV39856.1 uncharacterized protein Dana_GF10231 [Drosophila ananassae]
MFKKSCTDLTKIPKEQVLKWVKNIETIICDADGVLWHFTKAIDGAPEVFKRVTESGRNLFIVTNNSSMPSEAFAKRAQGLGFMIDEDHCRTSSTSIANFLKNKGMRRKVFVMGEIGIRAELDKVGIAHMEVDEKLDKSMYEFAKELEIDPDVGAVVIGRDERYNMARLIRTSAYLRNPDVIVVGTSMDAAYPFDEHRKVIVGASAMMTSVRALSGRQPLILGKPNPWILDPLLKCGVIKPDTTLMVGDTMTADMKFAHNCGFHSLLVGTGVHSFEDAQKIKDSGDKKKKSFIPDTYLPSFGHLLEFLT